MLMNPRNPRVLGGLAVFGALLGLGLWLTRSEVRRDSAEAVSATKATAPGSVDSPKALLPHADGAPANEEIAGERAPLSNGAPAPVEGVTPAPELDPRDADYPPAGGKAALLVPLFGGPDVFASAHADHDKQARHDRLVELEAALEEYVYGDPKDEAGKAKYTAIKEEIQWLREHPAP
jgi:hypothetical protein